MKTRILAFLICVFSVSESFAQTGGDHTYEFLNLTHSGLVTSLGGSNVSISGSNLNLSYHNPALLNSGMDKSFVLNYVNYLAGINYGLAMYSRSFGRTGNFAAGLAYLNYGSFTEADETGLVTGTFGSAEYAFPVIYSKTIDSIFSIGIDIKPVISQFERYNSFGVSFDIGASWHSRSNNTSAGIALRNAGIQVTAYAGEPRQKLPLEIQAGISQRLAYAPFRFSLTLRHLEKFDITYNYNESGPIGEHGDAPSGFLDNLISHAVPGVEIIPHKNFYFAAGYNFQRRKELSVPEGSASGLTWGFGINTSWMDIEFGRAVYHIASSSTNISLILRPDRTYRKAR